MKKITAILLIGITTLFFTGCDGGGDNVVADKVANDVLDDTLDGEKTDVILVDLILQSDGCSAFYEPENDIDGDRYYKFVDEDNPTDFYDCTYHGNDYLMASLNCDNNLDPEHQECSYNDYYSDGTPSEDSHLTDGELNGPYIERFPTGHIQVSGTYVNGEKDGTFTVYKAPGVLHAEEEWENGVRIDVEYYNI